MQEGRLCEFAERIYTDRIQIQVVPQHGDSNAGATTKVENVRHRDARQIKQFQSPDETVLAFSPQRFVTLAVPIVSVIVTSTVGWSAVKQEVAGSTSKIDTTLLG